jgi:hypothetical protein
MDSHWIKRGYCVILTSLSSLVFAGSMGPVVHMSENPAYIGVGPGYGKIDSNTSNIYNEILDFNSNNSFTSSLVDFLLSNVSQSGGFSGRVYAGYLFDVFSLLKVGPEFGFSDYASTHLFSNVSNVTELLNNLQVVDPSIGDIPDLSPYLGNGIARTQGYGFDILANLSLCPSQYGCVYVKPGLQLAHESTSSGITTSLYNFNTISTSNKMAPQFIVGGDWQVSHRLPLMLGVSYQYVFATSDVYGASVISSRSMLTLNFEYHFYSLFDE